MTLSVFRGSRRRRPYLYRKRAIHRSRPAYSCSLEEAQGSIREVRPLPPLNPSNSFMSRRERRKRMTMSVWEQRTSQLRRHRQMSSREILFSNATEDKDGTPAQNQSSHGQQLSMHRKAVQQTLSGSLKHLTEPSASVAKSQDLGSSVAVDPPLGATLAGGIPEPPMSVPDSQDPSSVPLADVPESVTLPEPPESKPVSESNNLDVSQSHNSTNELRSPRLNGNRQRRAVKKFRPPDNAPDSEGVRDRRTQHCYHHKEGDRGQGSSSQINIQLVDRSESKERNRNPVKTEEMEVVSKPETR